VDHQRGSAEQGVQSWQGKNDKGRISQSVRESAEPARLYSAHTEVTERSLQSVWDTTGCGYVVPRLTPAAASTVEGALYGWYT
jgi:hypothetical protein